MVSWGAHILVLLLWDENVMQKDSKGAFTLATQDYRDTYERFSTDEKAQITKQAQQTSSYVYTTPKPSMEYQTIMSLCYL